MIKEIICKLLGRSILYGEKLPCLPKAKIGGGELNEL
jgi:hypothetical protein